MADFRRQKADLKELKVVQQIRKLYFEIFTEVRGRKDNFLWEHCCRSLVSVGSNLSEGNKRSKKEKLRFIRIAEGSMAEFEFQLKLLELYNYYFDKIDIINAMIYKFKSAIRNQESGNQR